MAAGAGNIVATGGGNVIRAGSANIVASGAGNVIGGNGSAIVASGAGNIVASGAGNRRLLADDDLKELPVVGAYVFARDPRTLVLVPGLAPARTDERGAFRLVGVPAGTTLLLEMVFVGEDRTAARMLAMAKAEAPGAKPVTISTASTLVAAEVCKAAEAGGNQGQITLMERPAFDAMVDAMQAALVTDAGNMRAATKTLTMDVPKTGDVTLKQQETDEYYMPATVQAEAIAKKDATLAARTQDVQQVLTKPLDAAQQQAAAVLAPVVVPSPTAAPVTAVTSALVGVLNGTTVASTAPVATPSTAASTTSTTTVSSSTASPSPAATTATTSTATTSTATTSTTTTSTTTTSASASTTPTATPTPSPTAQPATPAPTPTPTPLLTVSVAPIALPSVKVSLPGL